MSKSNNIKIFLRIRPTKKPSRGLKLDEENNSVEVHVVKKDSRDYVNNQKEDYTFRFDSALNMQAKQEQVFEKVAKEVVDSVLEGYNGTVFAYGQTGSGKTYTITGGAESYSERGIIPRSISYIFSEMRRKTDSSFKISISYLEIYNDDGYDLLDENQCTRNLHDLPKVVHREDANGNIVLSNLSVHRADSEEDALNLLFIGDTNRVVAETPKHDASTRSHCIFIVQIEAQKLGTDTKTVSKLHLVDLAGSERVGKTNVDGVLLREARYINQSLHYLEHVIVTLEQKSRGENVFVPYRNSFMTLVLRDSLGGNCKTSMIATCSSEEGDLDESVSTFRFAQRVAGIRNEAKKNEQADPSIIIQRLKQEVAELKAEIKLLKGTDSEKDHLSPEESEDCRRMVEEWVAARDPSSRLILSDMLKINECFFHMKKMIIAGKGSSKVSEPAVDNEEVERLRLLVQQRDNEIAILLNHMNKQKVLVSESLTGEVKILDSPTKRSVDTATRLRERSMAESRTNFSTNIEITTEELKDRNKAFDIFRRSYRKNEAMNENKLIYKEKVENAKALTVTINNSRQKIQNITNEIEMLRKENAVQGLVDKNNVPLEHPKEEPLRVELEQLKTVYKKGVIELKDIKTEIERLQKLMQNMNQTLQRDFESWLEVMMKQSKSSVRDASVNENVQAFYKARDEIYKKMPNS
jgi:kinesin family protein 6/9